MGLVEQKELEQKERAKFSSRRVENARKNGSSYSRNIDDFSALRRSAAR